MNNHFIAFYKINDSVLFVIDATRWASVLRRFFIATDHECHSYHSVAPISLPTCLQTHQGYDTVLGNFVVMLLPCVQNLVIKLLRLQKYYKILTYANNFAQKCKISFFLR